MGGSQGSCGCQYSRKPEVSAERTVSWTSEYYRGAETVGQWGIYVGEERGRAARTCTGDLCSFSIVERGSFGPRPS